MGSGAVEGGGDVAILYPLRLGHLTSSCVCPISEYDDRIRLRVSVADPFGAHKSCPTGCTPSTMAHGTDGNDLRDRSGDGDRIERIDAFDALR
jgi:hypothetical protein